MHATNCILRWKGSAEDSGAFSFLRASGRGSHSPVSYNLIATSGGVENLCRSGLDGLTAAAKCVENSENNDIAETNPGCKR